MSVIAKDVSSILLIFSPTEHKKSSCKELEGLLTIDKIKL
ncbi:5308_t:CDS:2 [Scutellospora calospora]|uniref:5308_t:CDS:1 n=1 Tax=Scutellospora calospora TaxID=85575 RepID=A0ACA9K1L2_9GLOM|nr:5308_t:CDS:2 [Scutellospora calospora]